MTNRVATGEERWGDSDRLVGLVALGALIFRLGEQQGAFDKKLLRQLLDLHQQVAAFPARKASLSDLASRDKATPPLHQNPRDPKP